jgi:predicted nucleic-acid-binding protein
MRAVDTNVLVRLITRDDARKAAAAGIAGPGQRLSRPGVVPSQAHLGFFGLPDAPTGAESRPPPVGHL